MKFQTYDIVRVIQIPKSLEQLDGEVAVRIGQVGAVVMVHGPAQESYSVEAVEEGGRTLWVLDFLPEELELVKAADSI